MSAKIVTAGRALFLKEMRLSAHCLSFIFILFGLMFFVPGYPILCGVFFVTLGIFQSFQSSRENNDILFSVLLPFAKKSVVLGKFLFVVFIELCSLILMALVVLVRMFLLSELAVYVENPLMNANFFALGMAFVLFGLFNFIFVGGFFKTAYKFGRPFVLYIVVTFLLIVGAESLHYLPRLEWVNSFGVSCLRFQLILLAGGLLIYLLLTLLAYHVSCNRFERIDL